MRKKLRRTNQRLRRHAAGVEAVAAQLVLLDQRHLGFHRRRDVGRHQPRAAPADDDQVAIELRRPGPARIDLLRLDGVDDLFRDQRKDAEQGERSDQPRREDARKAVDVKGLATLDYVFLEQKICQTPSRYWLPLK